MIDLNYRSLYDGTVGSTVDASAYPPYRGGLVTRVLQSIWSAFLDGVAMYGTNFDGFPSSPDLPSARDTDEFGTHVQSVNEQIPS